jgi:glucose dehydrogenase
MQTVSRAVTVTIAVSSLLPAIISAQSPSAPTLPSAPSGVTAADIRAGLADPTRWLTFSGDYTGQRHSPLTQITPRNVGSLSPQWTFQTGSYARGRGFETTPLAADGVLYVTGSNNYAWAVDARTGRPALSAPRGSAR